MLPFSLRPLYWAPLLWGLSCMPVHAVDPSGGGGAGTSGPDTAGAAQRATQAGRAAASGSAGEAGGAAVGRSAQTGEAGQTLPQLGRAPLQAVIAALTLEEKVSLLTGKLPPAAPAAPADGGQAGAPADGAGEQAGPQAPAPVAGQAASPPLPPGPVIGQTQDKVPGAAGTTFAVPRLGIPSLVLADGPAGVRLSPQRPDRPQQRFFATAFPVGTALASTWDPALVERVGAAIGQEARAYGIDVMLAPALNLHRHPLGGRNFEYYAEDPLLSGRMAAAMVRGIQSQGVGTSIKHFAANNHEWNRDTIDVRVDERPLRELYLRGFELAVKEGRPWTVMTSYNKLNGHYTSESPWLLETVLRQQWGFDGLVMSDWFGGRDAVAQMQAGNDLLMPGSPAQKQAIIAAVREGRLDEKVLDRNVARMLALVQKSLVFAGHRPTDSPDLKTHAELARAVAAEGMVLLKNEDDALPLRAGARIALFGNSAHDTLIGGSGSGDVHEAHAISLAQGLAEAGFGLDPALSRHYQTHLAADPNRREPGTWHEVAPAREPWPEHRLPLTEIEAAAQRQDLAIISLGRSSGEFADRKKEDFGLNDTEQQLLAAVSKAFRARGKRVVVVLNVGGVIETASWRDQVDAILLAWQPGQEAGHAIADVLSGKLNPSGRLPDSFALRLADHPSDQNFPGVTLLGPDPARKLLPGEVADRAAEIRYQDGLRVGYRAFDAEGTPVAYPFGHGLSYTTFAYRDLTLTQPAAATDEAGGLLATVRITNTGKRAGREVVQLYLSAPRASDADKAAPELRAFARTRLLQPGESEIVRLSLGLRELASFDERQQRWVVPAGHHTVTIGASSRDIRLKGSFDRARTDRVAP